jgi:hypothetical protein
VRLYLKKTYHKKKRAGEVAQSRGPEFKPQYHQKQTINKRVVQQYQLVKGKKKSGGNLYHISKIVCYGKWIV